VQIRRHESVLLAYAQERLADINFVRMIATPAEKGPIICFDMKGAHAHDIATVVDRAGVGMRAGAHCAMPLLKRFGVLATCRASLGLYNTREEIDVLVGALIKARRLFS